MGALVIFAFLSAPLGNLLALSIAGISLMGRLRKFSTFVLALPAAAVIFGLACAWTFIGPMAVISYVEDRPMVIALAGFNGLEIMGWKLHGVSDLVLPASKAFAAGVTVYVVYMGSLVMFLALIAFLEGDGLVERSRGA